MFFSRRKVIRNDRNERSVGAFGRLKQSLSPELQRVDLTEGLSRIKVPEYSGEETPRMANQDLAFVAKYGIPIGTDGLVCCVAMAILYPAEEEHLVAHISVQTEIERLLNLVGKYEGKDVSVFLREGVDDYNVLERVYWELSKRDLPPATIIASGANLIAYGGNVYQIRNGQKCRTDPYDCNYFALAAPLPATSL